MAKAAAASSSIQDDHEPVLKKPARKRSHIWTWVAGGLLGMSLVGSGLYVLLRRPELPPAFRLKQALRYLDEHRDQAAHHLATVLRESGYQDPDFSGGVSFILGVCEFRSAEELEETSREPRYVLASTDLREAERLSLTSERRPEWAYVLGLCLYRLGSAEMALPLLEEAVATYPPGKVEAALLLSEVYLYEPTRETLAKALEINGAILADPALPQARRDHALLQRAQILLASGRRPDADEAMNQVSDKSFGSRGSAVLRAQTFLAEGDAQPNAELARPKFLEAARLLAPVANDERLDRTYTSQASYLMCVCAERLAEWENVISFSERTIERFERSHEALAARLAAAHALRQVGRKEESLESYAKVLRAILRPKNFRNRWLTLKRIREQILEAWTTWTEAGDFAEAMALAEIMSPVIPRDQAQELVARASLRWAERTEADLERLPHALRIERQGELWNRWRQCGQAYANLAELIPESNAFTAALWTSAECYAKGHEFEDATRQLTRFIDARSSTLVALALVRRGQAYLDLHRLDEAQHDFERVLQSSPTDPAAFEAQYLCGACYLERNQLAEAERTWRQLLESSNLTPVALEWRRALLSLGKLLYCTADASQQEQRRIQLTGGTPPAEQVAGIYSRLDEAVSRLDEFLARYPGKDDANEARFLLAKALERRTIQPEEKLRGAETEHARSELRRQIVEDLERAVREFQQLQMELVAQQTAGRLDPLGQTWLRGCFFGTANCLYRLGHFEEAITAYTSLAGRYPDDAEILTAYVQIANCYDRLHKPAEALSTLAQAQLILKSLSEGAFSTAPGSLSRLEWREWLDWAMRQHQ